MPAEPTLPPYGSSCSDGVGSLDWSEVDAHVPTPLLRSIIALRDFGACFSTGILDADRRALQDSGLFRSVTLDYSGHPESRQVTLRAQGRPLTIAAVDIMHYGVPSSDHEEASPVT